MDHDAATLLARAHATLVRQLSEIAVTTSKSLNLTNRHRRQLCHLDMRHVEEMSCRPPLSSPHVDLQCVTSFLFEQNVHDTLHSAVIKKKKLRYEMEKRRDAPGLLSGSLQDASPEGQGGACCQMHFTT